MEPKVALGCIIRDRAWILPQYLQALIRIVYPNKMYIFLENDSQDETLSILRNTPMDAHKTVHTLNTGCPYGERIWHAADGFSNLACLRNHFIDLFLQTDADYLLSIDSDIIVPPDILAKLMNGPENSIIGAAISNIAHTSLDGRTPGNFLINNNGIFVHPTSYPLTGYLDVDLIGAVYLIPRRALVDGVRYEAHQIGEDLPFCLQAKEKGYRIMVLLDLVCEHHMERS